MSYKRNQIPLRDFKDRLKANPVIAYGNLLKTGEEAVPEQIATMKQELMEKKLLNYQINVKKGDINEFLLNKYSDGNYNQAIIDGYDNSKNRLENGITYEYHVYWPMKEEFNDKRPHKKYWMSPEILDFKNGDSYFYHLPIYISDPVVTVYKTDLEGEEVEVTGVSKSKNGLVYALTELKKLIEKKGNIGFPAFAEAILRRHGFTNSDGTIKYNVENNLAVEKYLKGIKQEKRHNALLYLNKEFKSEDEVKKVAEYDEETDKVPLDGKKLETKLTSLKKRLETIVDEMTPEHEYNFKDEKVEMVDLVLEKFRDDVSLFKVEDTFVEDYKTTIKKSFDLIIEEYEKSKDAINALYDKLDKDGKLKRKYNNHNYDELELEIKAQLEDIRVKEEEKLAKAKEEAAKRQAEDAKRQAEADKKAAEEKKKKEEEKLREDLLKKIDDLLFDVKENADEIEGWDGEEEWDELIKDKYFKKLDDDTIEGLKEKLGKLEEFNVKISGIVKEYKEKLKAEKAEKDALAFKILTDEVKIKETFADKKVKEIEYFLDMRQSNKHTDYSNKEITQLTEQEKEQIGSTLLDVKLFIANSKYVTILKMKIGSYLGFTYKANLTDILGPINGQINDMKDSLKISNSPNIKDLLTAINTHAQHNDKSIEKSKKDFEYFLYELGQKTKDTPFGIEIVND